MIIMSTESSIHLYYYSLHAVRLYIGVRGVISLRGAPIYRRKGPARSTGPGVISNYVPPRKTSPGDGIRYRNTSPGIETRPRSGKIVSRNHTRTLTRDTIFYLCTNVSRHQHIIPALVYRNYLNESHESSEQHTAKSAGEEMKQQESS